MKECDKMLNEILSSSYLVEKSSKDVYIDRAKLEQFCFNISNIKTEHWLNSSPFGLLELSIDKIINILLIFESIDFSFWSEPKWGVEIDGKMFDGSIALLYLFIDYVKKYDSTDFSKVTKEEFFKMLNKNAVIPLFNERYEIVVGVSRIVNEKMHGDFYGYIKDIYDDRELFDIIIKNFPHFKDERNYNGMIVPFYKLAQLLVSDILHIRKIKEDIVVDYSNLVGCSDYKIPQVLRTLEIIVYSDRLSDLIDRGIEIEENSSYEVEIRAMTLVVIDMIKKKLDNRYSAIDINEYLYMQKNNPKLVLKNYHKTRNVNY